MPTVDQNRAEWDRDWEHDGSDWTAAWGSERLMWHGSIMSRIGNFLPTGRLLEIATGYGRVTQYLLGQCESYVGIDLSSTCVAACEERFAGVAHAEFHQTGGHEIPNVEDASIDFAVSWDSLVHADQTVLDAYVAELTKKLKPGAYAFIHHSNLAAFLDPATGEPTVETKHWRDKTVSAETIRESCKRHRMACVVQEIVKWGEDYDNDCFTLMRRPVDPAEADAEPTIRPYPDLPNEIRYFREMNALYWSVPKND